MQNNYHVEQPESLLLLFLVEKNVKQAQKLSKKTRSGDSNRLATDINKQAIDIRTWNKTYKSGALDHSTTSHSLLYYVHTEHQTTIELTSGPAVDATCLGMHAVKWSWQRKLISVKVLPSGQVSIISSVQTDTMVRHMLAYTSQYQTANEKPPAIRHSCCKTCDLPVILWTSMIVAATSQKARTKHQKEC